MHPRGGGNAPYRGVWFRKAYVRDPLIFLRGNCMLTIDLTPLIVAGIVIALLALLGAGSGGGPHSSGGGPDR